MVYFSLILKKVLYETVVTRNDEAIALLWRGIIVVVGKVDINTVSTTPVNIEDK